MKSIRNVLAVAVVAQCLIAPGYTQTPTPYVAPQPSNFGTSVDILSDTGGVNINPYMKKTISDLTRRWDLLVPDTARHPLAKDEASITFTIAADGKVSAMMLGDRTHNVALDKAAWSAVTTTSFLPPPTGSLKLRVHFVVN
jgi:TonB family protein